MNFDLISFVLIVDDALQIEDDNLWECVEVGALEDAGHLAVALLAEVVCDFLPFSELPKAIN